MRLFLSIALLSLMPLSHAHAQLPLPGPSRGYSSIDDIQKQAHIFNPKFEAMARAALSEMPPRFNFTNFKIFYTKTRQYDPLGEEAINALLKNAFIMQTQSDDEAAYNEALKNYQLIIMDHMAHLGVVMQAYSLAKTDKRFGNPKFFQWLKNGLVRELIQSGDGHSLQSAYDIIVSDEEEVLFTYLSMQPIETKAVQEGVIYYNMHTARDLNDKTNHTVFVNTSFPMEFLEAKSEMESGFRMPLRKR